MERCDNMLNHSTRCVQAASKYSTCASAARGGKLGKFVPGAMAPEFDEVIFGLYDTGKLNPRNESPLYEPKYEVGEVHGPVKTKFGYHLIKIETRYVRAPHLQPKCAHARPRAEVRNLRAEQIAEYDFRLKEDRVIEL